jgi:general secretion pathway protein D
VSPVSGKVPGKGKQEKGYDPDERTQVDFEDVDIKAVLRFLAEKTHTNYFLDPSIQAKITVIGPREIKLSEAVTFLEAALEARGFTVVDSGTFKQVIPQSRAAASDVPLYLKLSEHPGTPLEKERTVTQIIQLRHAPVAEVKAAIQGLLSPTSKVLEHVPTNKLILTETLRNLERLRRVIAELDVPVQGKTVFLLPLRHRKAADMVTQVSEILVKEESEKRFPQTKEVQATKPALLADLAQNILIVVATGKDFRKVKALVEKIDVDPEAGPVIEFLPLKNAQPGDVVQRITAALQGDGAVLPPFSLVADERTQMLLLRTRSQNLRAQIKAAVCQLDRVSQLPERVQVRVYRMNFAEATKIAELLGQVDFSAGLPGVSKPGGKGAAPNGLPGGKLEVKIVADENTNSLVITAPQAMFPSIERVVRELDVVKPQVMVEVLIAEVDYDWAVGRGLDVNFLNEQSTSNNRAFGIGNLNQVEGLAAGGLPDGLSLGLLHGRNFDFAAAAGGDLGEISKIAALIRLFQGTTHANILSSPTLLTSDNEEARIAIGERIQLPGSFATAANTGLNTVTSFNSEDLGVILEITPRITRDDHVILKVEQSIKARTGDLLGSLETPVLSNREVSTSINTLDGETVVIGGLLSEEEQISESRIPLLSRLPGIGKLFRSRKRSTRKTNLMIFLTPHIMRGEAGVQRVTELSRQEISREIEHSKSSANSWMRKAFAPGRSLGRYRTEDPREKKLAAMVEITPGATREISEETAGDLTGAQVESRIDELLRKIRSKTRSSGRGIF